MAKRSINEATSFAAAISRKERYCGVSVFLITLALLSANASAQTTGGVFGPVVNEGHRSAEYRVVIDPGPDSLAQRIHYQQSLNDDLMWRVVVQTRKSVEATADFDFVQAELFWQLKSSNSPWQQGLRFDVRVTDEDRPAAIGVHWMNERSLSEAISVRAVLLTALQFGNNARDGVFLQTRGRINYAINRSVDAGIEMYNTWGSTSDPLGVDDQRHQFGVYSTMKFAKHWHLTGSALFGLTGSTDDTNIRLFIGRSF